MSESTVKEVPHIPLEWRTERYEEAVDDYLNDRIDEDELEIEIEYALRGRVGFRQLLKQIELAPIRGEDLPKGSKYSVFGVKIDSGQSVVLDRLPDFEETREVVE